VRFIRSWIERPLSIGAVTPSGKILARVMAGYVDPNSTGPVVELGPGTGPVTEALVEAGVDPARLVLVEFNPAFCRILQKRYPDVPMGSYPFQRDGKPGTLSSSENELEETAVQSMECKTRTNPSLSNAFVPKRITLTGLPVMTSLVDSIPICKSAQRHVSPLNWRSTPLRGYLVADAIGIALLYHNKY